MKKELSRRSFLVGCGLLTFSSFGIFFTSCGNDDSLDGNKNDSKDTNVSTSKDTSISENKVVINEKNRTIAISENDLSILKSKSFLNVPSENLVVFSDSNIYYGYSNICPHEQGRLKIENKTTIRCLKHTKQTFANKGQTNRAKTSKSLELVLLNIETY